MRESLTAIPPRVATSALLVATSGWYSGATAEYVEVPISSLLSAIELLETERIRSAQRVLSTYAAQGVAPFVSVLDQAGGAHLGLLIEKCDQGLLILDGTHRAFAARRAGRTRVSGTLITPKRLQPPPAILRPIDEIQEVVHADGPKFAGRQPPTFRPAVDWLERWSDQIRIEGGLE